MTEKEAHELKNISEWLGKLRFRKKFFGGVDEQDVWKKLEELNEMYETALIAERARFDALLEHYKESESDSELESESETDDGAAEQDE